MHCTWYFIL
jgi:hypothetical protein